ncbi:MAG: aspartate aminotransferase family protein [Candidatus Eremiobacteraeota bacterium]|nr:aspartate aminotransferase family protein [Candidatus Eremiobacteraeota bacterium]
MTPPERLGGAIPGMRSRALLQRLHLHESRNLTFFDEAYPVVWDRAQGALVTDVDGNRYIDCTSAFGVANAGHSNARVVGAIAAQARELLHAMGDVHPAAMRVRLLERLITILPKGLQKVILATSGSDAVEAAIKTAILATGKTRVAAYRGGYHGLSLGALIAGGIPRFRQPFERALGPEPLLLEFPRVEAVGADEAAQAARKSLSAHPEIAAIIGEPIQGRAGVIVPPHGYLAALRDVCTELRIVMIADEIYTGFGRTGEWFAIEGERVVPDILCIGKAMGSGVAISAAAGRSEVMDAWPVSTGEALHTSTHLGDPLGCAAALATIEEMTRLQLPARAARLGQVLGGRLASLREMPSVVAIRGRGLFWGIELSNNSLASAVVKGALTRGVLLLQSGVEGQTITLAPPLVIEESALLRAIDILRATLAGVTRYERTPERA